MPFSIESTGTGYATFAAVKFVGYSLFALALNRGYVVRRNPLLIGAARTLLGMALGGLYYGAWRSLSIDTHSALYWPGLLPLRIFEWWLLIHVFYDRGLQRQPVGKRYIIFGILVSYILDIPAAIGYVFCGISIC